MSDEEIARLGRRAAERWSEALGLLAAQEADDQARATELAEALMFEEDD